MGSLEAFTRWEATNMKRKLQWNYEYTKLINTNMFSIVKKTSDCYKLLKNIQKDQISEHNFLRCFGNWHFAKLCY